MPKPSTASALLATFLLTACSDHDGPRTPVQPGFTTLSPTVEFRPSIGLGTQVLSAQPADEVRCPDAPPFVAPFTVTLAAPRVDVSLDSVRLKFFDVVGVPMPQVTLTQPSLSTEFGSTVVRAHSSRTFPFRFRFGCGTARRGTLIIIVDTRDPRGQTVSEELRAAVQ